MNRIIDQFDRQLRKARIHGVPERRDLRRRRARLMAARVAAPIAGLAPTPEQVRLMGLGPNWTLGDLFESFRMDLASRRRPGASHVA